jgi:hypothetical protein
MPSQFSETLLHDPPLEAACRQTDSPDPIPSHSPEVSPMKSYTKFHEKSVLSVSNEILVETFDEDSRSEIVEWAADNLSRGSSILNPVPPQETAETPLKSIESFS